MLPAGHPTAWGLGTIPGTTQQRGWLPLAPQRTLVVHNANSPATTSPSEYEYLSNLASVPGSGHATEGA